MIWPANFPLWTSAAFQRPTPTDAGFSESLPRQVDETCISHGIMAQAESFSWLMSMLAIEGDVERERIR